MTKTTEILRVPYSKGSSDWHTVLHYPSTPNRLWCDIQFIEHDDFSGALKFFTASGGSAGDLKNFLQWGDTPQYPTPVNKDTIECYTLMLTAQQVDELFDNKIIADFWVSWSELFSHFKFSSAPDSLIRTLNLIYTKMENR